MDPTPGQPDATTIHRPSVPIRVIGPSGQVNLFALLDTGADETVLPAFVTGQIGVDVDPLAQARFRGVGGQLITVEYGKVDLEVREGRERYRWTVTVAFLHGAIVAILGHAGFLQYFSATFDGQRRQVTLTPNATLPAQHAP